MKKKLNLIPTGISLVDKAWGGFYRGGTYLLIGQRKSGKTLVGLQYAMESAKNKEVCLFFTSMRPKDLMIHAASIDFDLQSYMNQNLIIVVRVAPPTDLYELGNPDNFLIEYLNDIVTVVDQYQPNRLIFDELTHFIGFENPQTLEQTYLQTIETIEDKNVTSLFVVAEPATPLAQLLVDGIVQHSTAVIYLQKQADEEGKVTGGRATITPNVGHTEGQFVTDYYIEPYKGVYFDFEQTPKFQNPFPVVNTVELQQEKPSLIPASNQSSKYKPLTNIDFVPEKFSFSNLYDINDFTLILNNQIALYKSTGQPFTLFSMKLDEIAERQKILTINQLQNAIRLSTDKKDKLCIVNNKILILVSKADDKTLNQLVSKIRGNLPNSDPKFQEVIMNYLFACTYQVNDKVENAEYILHEILEDEPSR
ncbi:MAG: RAD55 family ATPase [Ignavibacteriaceae bacterium]|nr:RAD55 family ATPase [Ignavibacteriaceae bacterium]